MSIELGLLGTGLGLGLRHGVDWDHIAAIADVTGSERRRWRAMGLGTLYALGHALVVTVLGLAALLFGSTLPESTDSLMEVVVGLTLIALGFWLYYSVFRYGADFQLRSRWMLVFGALGRLRRWIESKATGHEHPHPQRAGGAYGAGTSFGIGMIHGVGAETGSQALLLAAAAGATSQAAGSVLLVAFVVGLVLSNSLLAVGSVLGFWSSRTNRVFYIAIGLLAATFSFVVGFIFLFERSSLLPSILT